MIQDELARVRGDLDRIESAIGLPRWDPQQIRINLLFAVSGLVAAAWAFIPHGLSPLLGLLSFAVPVLAWLRLARHHGSQTYDRDFRSACRTLWLLLPLIALFAFCRQIGLSPLHFLWLSIFFIGAVLFSAAVGESQGRSYIGWAAAFMVCGLLIPMQIAPVIAVLAGAITVGGVISAALAYVSREESSNHAAG